LIRRRPQRGVCPPGVVATVLLELLRHHEVGFEMMFVTIDHSKTRPQLA